MSATKVSVQNGQLEQIMAGLGEVVKIKLPASAALKVRRTVRAVTDHMKDVEEVRKAILDRHTKKDEEGNPVAGEREGTVQLVSVVEFAEEYSELMEHTVELEPIRLSWLAKDADALDKLELEPSVLINLGDLLIEDVE